MRGSVGDSALHAATQMGDCTKQIAQRYRKVFLMLGKNRARECVWLFVISVKLNMRQNA